MSVLIAGAGEVDYNLAQRLSDEKQDVVLIETDPDRAAFAQQQLNMLTVVGNVGPGFGRVGATEDYGWMSDPAR